MHLFRYIAFLKVCIEICEKKRCFSVEFLVQVINVFGQNLPDSFFFDSENPFKRYKFNCESDDSELDCGRGRLQQQSQWIDVFINNDHCDNICLVPPELQLQDLTISLKPIDNVTFKWQHETQDKIPYFKQKTVKFASGSKATDSDGILSVDDNEDEGLGNGGSWAKRRRRRFSQR
jgi:hypothetical protein